MMKKIATLFTAAFMLGACHENTEHTANTTTLPAPLQCSSDEASLAFSHTLLSNMNEALKDLAKTDVDHFVDTNRVMGAATRLNLSVTKAAPVSSAGTHSSVSSRLCRAKVSVTIAPADFKVAEENSTILYPKDTLSSVISHQAENSSVTFNNKTFSIDVLYQPKFPFTIEGVSMNQLAQLLGVTLMPFGVKEYVLIDGQLFSRKDAGSIVANPALLNELANPELLHEANQEKARAKEHMKEVWQSLAPEIRQEMKLEQDAWQKQAPQRCQYEKDEAAQTRCEVQLYNDRANYLAGFAI